MPWYVLRRGGAAAAASAPPSADNHQIVSPITVFEHADFIAGSRRTIRPTETAAATSIARALLAHVRRLKSCVRATAERIWRRRQKKRKGKNNRPAGPETKQLLN